MVPRRQTRRAQANSLARIAKPSGTMIIAGSRQNNHHQPDQYNAEANRADEKSAQARPRFEPETRNPFLTPTIHKKGLSVKVPTTFDCALSRDETR
jgi:hypothetical protein